MTRAHLKTAAVVLLALVFLALSFAFDTGRPL